MHIPTPAVPARRRELQNPLDRLIYHPIAARLARRLARTPVTPNMVSLAGAMLVVLAATAYAQPGWPGPAIAGLLLHMSWHVLDGADGDLARLTGRASPVGEIVDGVCDYASHLVLYLVLGTLLAGEIGHWAWPVMVAAGLSHVVQANFHEVHKRQYMHWAYDTPWLRHKPASSASPILARLAGAYLAVASWLDPGDEALDAALRDPERGAGLRARILAIGPGAFAGSSLLGLNYRTLALGGSMLAGSPLWYFAYVATLLNVLLIVAIWRSRAAIRALV
jgi:phosphatidylglycerophosphate synthase